MILSSLGAGMEFLSEPSEKGAIVRCAAVNIVSFLAKHQASVHAAAEIRSCSHPAPLLYGLLRALPPVNSHRSYVGRPKRSNVRAMTDTRNSFSSGSVIVSLTRKGML